MGRAVVGDIRPRYWWRDDLNKNNSSGQWKYHDQPQCRDKSALNWKTVVSGTDW